MGQLVRAVVAGRRARALFKTLSSVEVKFNPYDHRATTAREFLRRVRTPPVREENPKLKISVVTAEEYGAPHILLKYVDGYEQSIAPMGMKIVDIIDQVERVARWRGPGAHNPFEKVREARAAKLADGL